MMMRERRALRRKRLLGWGEGKLVGNGGSPGRPVSSVLRRGWGWRHCGRRNDKARLIQRASHLVTNDWSVLSWRERRKDRRWLGSMDLVGAGAALRAAVVLDTHRDWGCCSGSLGPADREELGAQEGAREAVCGQNIRGGGEELEERP